nr:MAG TPA: hypothetical protein [Caudoviricetes sp.]
MTNEQMQECLDKQAQIISEQNKLLMETNRNYQELLSRSERRIGNVNVMMQHLAKMSNGFQHLCTDLEHIYETHIRRVTESRERLEKTNARLSEALQTVENKHEALLNKFIELASKPNISLQQSKS